MNKQVEEISRSGERGFSIIEMLIAIAVVTFGLASVVGISAYVSRANSTSNCLNVLAAAAQDQVDRLRTAQWTSTTESPVITVGGSLYTSPMSSDYRGVSNNSPVTYGGATTTQYNYRLDPENPHHALASNSPVGNLDISWQVRQGSTPDLRYVTIKVVQIGAPANLRDGFSVTTMIVRN